MPSEHALELANAVGQLLGPDLVTSSVETIEQHSYDIWPVATKWQQQGKRPYQPEIVVYPRTTEQISTLLAWASEQHVPVTPWGLGSSVTGSPIATRGGVTLDLSHLQRIVSLSEANLLVRVEAGMLGIALERTLNERGFTLGHSPQSLDRSSVGGWVATRATGQFSSRYGGIEDLVVALSAVLPTGEIVQTPMVPRAAMGPDLRQVFMGAEGTMGVITDVTLKMFPLPETRLVTAVGFREVRSGLAAMRRMMQSGLRPFLLRFYDEDEARYAMQDMTFTGCAMFLGCEGMQTVAEAEYSAALDMCMAAGGQELGPAPVQAWLGRRFDFSQIERRLATPGGFAETIEIAHFWDQIDDTYRALKEALALHAGEVLGHFSHAYSQGTSLYLILFDQANDDAQAESRLMEIWHTAMEACLRHGAALSHHHGMGLARLPFIREALGSGFPVLERIKAAIDPAGIMNPDKLGLMYTHEDRGGPKHHAPDRQ